MRAVCDLDADRWWPWFPGGNRLVGAVELGRWQSGTVGVVAGVVTGVVDGSRYGWWIEPEPVASIKAAACLVNGVLARFGANFRYFPANLRMAQALPFPAGLWLRAIRLSAFRSLSPSLGTVMVWAQIWRRHNGAAAGVIARVPAAAIPFCASARCSGAAGGRAIIAKTGGKSGDRGGTVAPSLLSGRRGCRRRRYDAGGGGGDGEYRGRDGGRRLRYPIGGVDGRVSFGVVWLGGRFSGQVRFRLAPE